MSQSSDFFANEVIRASAGTGKTFQLSNRYLGLVAVREPFETILATTFTKKAAGEILDRVLLRLAEAVIESDKREELGRFTGNESFTADDWLSLLHQMVHRLHSLRISTLDQFFLQLARIFSLELAMPPGWRIVDETVDARLQAEAIQNILAEHDTSDVLRLMHQLTKGDVARSVENQLATLVKNLYSIYLDAPAEAWDAFRPPAKPADTAIHNALYELRENRDWTTHKSILKALDSDYERFCSQDFEKFLSGGLAKAVAEGKDVYYRQPIPPTMVDAYETLLAKARVELIFPIINQTRATRELLERFDRAYHALKQSRRGFRFEDVTRRVADSLGLNPQEKPNLRKADFRLDGRLSHLLLDEFQDTSPIQWRVLRPFAHRTVEPAPHRSFFCVGDVKQAIYGWRGGVAEIFEAIDRELANLTPGSLETSYRSSPVVIETVNRVFGSLMMNQALQNYSKAAETWAGRYAIHSTARSALAGHATLEVVPMRLEEGEEKVSTDESQVQVEQYTTQRIAELHRKLPGASIGVLVRRNETVGRLIGRLRSLGIRASEEGGNPLTDSSAVQVVLSALALADHPGDRTARYHVAHSPLGACLGLVTYDDDRLAGDVARSIREELAEAGYGPTIYRWTQAMAPSCDSRDLNRLVQLVEMAYGYEIDATSRADHFIETVQKRRVEDPSSANVRVMTVHQSKGLQFDIVILPELNQKLTGNTPTLLVDRPSPTEPVRRVCRYVNKDIRRIMPEVIEKMSDTYTQQSVEESLCLLYVAMTRAVHALHMIAANPTQISGRGGATYANVLIDGLGEGFQLGEADWFANEPHLSVGDGAVSGGAYPRADQRFLTRGQAPPLTEPPPCLSLAPSTRRRRGWEHTSPSKLEGGNRVRLAERLRSDPGRRNALQEGTVLHAWFETITWLDQGTPDRERLREIALRLGGVENIDRLLDEFYRLLEKPANRAVLSLSAYTKEPTDPSEATPIHVRSGVRQPEWRVWTERPFTVRDGGSTIMTGVIDRLVVLFDGQTPIGAEVLDFKTDRIAAEQRPDRIEFYRPQIEAYRRAVLKWYPMLEE
ncbi:MAG: UvrD-helicase domain-containing protein, partial [Planctomycetia bacterium]